MTIPKSVTASHYEISSVPKNKLSSTMPTAEFEIRIACDLRGLRNIPFSADHREIAAKTSFSAEILHISRQINLQIISIEMKL
jgi:hypothetical protein